MDPGNWIPFAIGNLQEEGGRSKEEVTSFIGEQGVVHGHTGRGEMMVKG